MREAYRSGCDAIRSESGRHRAVLPAADWLGLAAAPTFAIMALLTSVLGGGPADVLCGAASPLSGMTAMYVLMSGFHLRPWLKLIAGRSCAAARGTTV